MLNLGVRLEDKSETTRVKLVTAEDLLREKEQKLKVEKAKELVCLKKYFLIYNKIYYFLECYKKTKIKRKCCS